MRKLSVLVFDNALVSARPVILASLVSMLWIASSSAWAQASAPEPSDGEWQFAVTPYIWLPAMDGSTTVKGNEVDIDTTISDIFTESDFAFALQAEFEALHRSNWGIFGNGQWAILEQNDNLGGSPLEFDLKMNNGIFEVGGFYSLGAQPMSSDAEGATITLEPLFGARLTVIKVELDFDNFSTVDDTKTFVDPFLGARAIFRFGSEKRWTAIVRGDIGGFGVGSDFTWNALAVFGYDFNIGKVPSTFHFGVRGLYQDYEDGSGSDKFEWDVTQYGPLVALRLKF